MFRKLPPYVSKSVLQSHISPQPPVSVEVSADCLPLVRSPLFEFVDTGFEFVKAFAPSTDVSQEVQHPADCRDDDEEDEQDDEYLRSTGHL